MSLKSHWCVSALEACWPAALKEQPAGFSLQSSPHTFADCGAFRRMLDWLFRRGSVLMVCVRAEWLQPWIHDSLCCCRTSPWHQQQPTISSSFSPHNWENIRHTRCSYMENIYLGGHLKTADWIHFCRLTLIWYRILHFVCVCVITDISF